MKKYDEMRAVGIFTFITFLYSWPIFFIGDAWLAPRFARQGNIAGDWLTGLFGHILGMLGPMLTAIIMWRWYHNDAPPPWKWSRPKYYGLVALVMLALWTLPALAGLIIGNTLQFRNPITFYIWIMIGSSLLLGWLAGLGEEVGWTAYLLSRLTPYIGKTRAVIVSGMIRGVWHLPVLIAPLLTQFIAGEKPVWHLIVMPVVLTFQLAISNVFFGAVWSWIWYRTESMPLAGWMHQWYDLARDVTNLLVVGYVSSIWPKLIGLVFIFLGLGLLKRMADEEGVDWGTIWRLPNAKGHDDVIMKGG